MKPAGADHLAHNCIVESARRIRVLVAKPGLDGHDRGARIVARALRDAGMEVIYTGLRQTPEMIVSAALQEDVDCIGLSILSGAHNALVPRLLRLMRERHLTDVLLVLGGIVPGEDARELRRQGVAEVFSPGTPTSGIVEFIRRHVRPAPSLASLGEERSNCDSESKIEI